MVVNIMIKLLDWGDLFYITQLNPFEFFPPSSPSVYLLKGLHTISSIIMSDCNLELKLPMELIENILVGANQTQQRPSTVMGRVHIRDYRHS